MNNDVINTFKKLVEVYSPSGGEQDLAKILVVWLKKHKFSVTVDAVGNIYARNSMKEKPRFLLCTHMDTVEPSQNIQVVTKGGYIHSAGDTILGADNKATVAAIVAGIEEYVQAVKQLPSFEIIFSVREETGGGLEHLPKKMIQSPVGFTFDKNGPLGGIILGSPYITNFTITLTGKSAHASRPDLGINVTTGIATLIQKIDQGLLDKGKTLVNMGLIQSGTGVNTIAGQAVIQGEIRSFSETLFNKRKESIQKIGTSMIKSGLKVSVVFDAYSAGYNHSKVSAPIMLLQKVYKELQLPVYFESPQSVSDANILNQYKGLSVINCTDGVSFSHTCNERIKVKDLEMLKKIIIKIIGEHI